MTIIVLETQIKASQQTVFNLARNIDVHIASSSQTQEKAIAGTTFGLISLGETVTWKGKHFGIWWKLTSKITAMQHYNTFTDEMVKGPFKSIKHLHSFSHYQGITTMKDIFCYEIPYGVFGSLFNSILLKKHMHDFLIKRNQHLKKTAESISK